VYSTDPEAVAEAVLLEELSFKEALELCFFGAKVSVTLFNNN
jgi:aspartokinase